MSVVHLDLQRATVPLAQGGLHFLHKKSEGNQSPKAIGDGQMWQAGVPCYSEDSIGWLEKCGVGRFQNVGLEWLLFGAEHFGDGTCGVSKEIKVWGSHSFLEDPSQPVRCSPCLSGHILGEGCDLCREQGWVCVNMVKHAQDGQRGWLQVKFSSAGDISRVKSCIDELEVG